MEFWGNRFRSCVGPLGAIRDTDDDRFAPPEEEREHRLARLYWEMQFIVAHSPLGRCDARLLARLVERDLVSVVTDLMALEMLGFAKREYARGWVPLEVFEEDL